MAIAAVAAAALGLLCGGCSKTPHNIPATSSAAPIAKSSSDELHYDDPCSLLEPKEVEAAMGAPLAVPPYRSGGAAPVASGDDCVYETADFHRIMFHVDFKDGAQAYGIGGIANKLLGGHPDAATKKAFRLDNGTELNGEWDEARLMAMNCCIFMTMRGDQAIQIDFTSSDATLPQAAELVNAAYRRIDKPLTLDGAAGVDAAKAHAKQRPLEVDACKLLPRAEAEAILGKLATEPTGSKGTCTYELPAEAGRRLYELNIRWRGGYEKFRSDPYVAGIAMNALLANTPLGKKENAAQNDQAPAEAGPWYHAADQAGGFMAVKKDVVVTVNSLGASPEGKRKLAAAVMSKI